MGKIYIFLGKSASGKDTIFKKIIEKEELELNSIVTYTTRPIREGETNGVEYYFVDNNKMKELEKQGKIIERRTYDTMYGPWDYFTVDDGQVNLEHKDYAIIGTLQSYIQIRDYYGKDKVEPIYIDVEDGERLSRALKRERQQKSPKYTELCRRFIEDTKDFSQEELDKAGIIEKFDNDDIQECIGNIIFQKFTNK